MGVPVSDVKAAGGVSAESLLESFKSIDAAERRRHASVLNYWLSIRGDKDVAPIRDLDPLEISDAGPNSLLLELIGGGEDAEIKHRGDALSNHAGHDRLSQSPRPSLLACIAGKLAIVAISRNFLAFEDKFTTEAGETRCWITLLPFSSTGVWVDYVYAFVTVEGECAVGEEPVAAAEPVEEAIAEAAVEQPAEPEEAAVVDEAAGDVTAVEEAVPDVEEIDIPPIIVEGEAAEVVEEVPEVPAAEPVEAVEESGEVEVAEYVPEPEPELEPEAEAASEKRPGFSKIFEALTGFHGTNVKVEPTLPPVVEEAPAESEPLPEIAPETQTVEIEVEPEPEILELDVAEEIVAEPSPGLEVEAAEAVDDVPAEPVSHSAEGTLQSKLEEVRAKADEARLAKLRSNLALYEGLGAAYDFALDAEHSPEEYLRLVEAQGLKIQLRSPMTPVVKLAFDGLCDDSMIGQLEAVLAWALKQDLPRGTLAEKIESAGGIGPLLNVQAEAA